MTQLLDDLRALDALLSDESKWTKGAPARDRRSGAPTNPDGDAASCWCLDAGIVRVCSSTSIRVVSLRTAIGFAGAAKTYRWNDAKKRSFPEVKPPIARAIATEEGRVK